jgi:uncharacterized protein DUF222/HNH endonuclease
MSDALEMREVGPSTGEIDAFLHALALPSGAVDDAGRIDRIAALERVKAAASAAQVRETVAFKESQEEQQVLAGVPTGRIGRDVGSQVALARRVSPWQGDQLVGLAVALVEELPATLDAMTSGECAERKATIVARETAFLVPPHRREVDAAMAADLGRLSDRKLAAEARTHAYRLDPAGFTRRAAQADADRYVSFRSAPETMVQMSALLPLREGIATQKALLEAVEAAKASGDQRSRAQLMADALFERVTGVDSADRIPVEIQLVMSDGTLLGDSSEPAVVPGHGPMPAPLARRWLNDLPEETKAWIRRLYTHPDTGRLVAMESTRRCFEGLLRQVVVVRDQFCRTPYCNAPIRHGDHVVSSEDGGDTSEPNGQGLCEHCNYVKSMPGWHARPDPDCGAGADVTVTTPTGHTYGSSPPRLPGSPRLSGAPPGRAEPAGDSAAPAAKLRVRRWQRNAEVYYRPRGHDRVA